MGCDPADEGSKTWFEGWNPDDVVDSPTVAGAHRVTIEHPEGAMTFAALDAAEQPLAIRGGLSWYSEGELELLFTDRDALYAFEPERLQFTKVTDWTDGSGTPVEVLGIHRLSMNGSPVIVVRESAQVRVYDAATQTLSVPVEMVELNSTTGVYSAFEPATLTVVPSFELTIGHPYVAIGPEGGLYLGRQQVVGSAVYLVFVAFQPVQRECVSMAPISVEQLVAANLPDGAQMWPETLIAVSDSEQFILTDDRCLQPIGLVVDDNEDPIQPLAGFDVDLDVDGTDTVVWVHP